MTRTIAIMNQKGGVGKTTTTFNLAHALAIRGHNVMIVDMDPQGHLSASFGLQDIGVNGVDSVLLDHADLDAHAIELRERLKLVPAGEKLTEMEFVTKGGSERGYRLAKAIKSLGEKYEFVLIDCPPSAGLLGMNCLLAAGEILIPVSSDYLAMHGLYRLMGIIQHIETKLNKTTEKRLVITRFQERRLLAKQVKDKLISYFPGKVFSTIIKEAVALAESPGYGQTIFDYRKNCRSAEEYLSLADDLLMDRTMTVDEQQREAS